MWYPSLVEPRDETAEGDTLWQGGDHSRNSRRNFPTEASCAAFLFKRRWPDGFVCPPCGGDRAAALKSRAYTFQCYGCRSSDVHHGGHGNASHAACADGVVLGPPI